MNENNLIENLEPQKITDIPVILFEKVKGWVVDGATLLPNVVVALVIGFVFWIIAKGASGTLYRWLTKSRVKISPMIARLISSTVKLLILASGIFTALSIVGLDKTVTSLLAGVGLIGLGLAYAFQNIMSNFVSGILIVSQKMVKVGDYISVNDQEGSIIDINLRTTTIETLTGQQVLIPNKNLFENTVTNYAGRKSRRVDIPCGVSYDEDLNRVENVVKEVISELSARAANTPVGFVYTEFADSSVNFNTNFWIDDNSAGAFLSARSEAIKAIRARFATENIDIPYPISVGYKYIMNHKNDGI